MLDKVTFLSSEDELKNIQKSSGLLILFFYADWHEPSKQGGQMHQLLGGLAQKYNTITFTMLEAENIPAVSEKYGVSVVPTFVCLDGANVLFKHEGVNPPELGKLIKRVAEDSSQFKVIQSNGDNAVETSKPDLDSRLRSLVQSAPVMLFMKGTPDAPRCGFSRKTVELLRAHSVSFASFDILQDEEVRAGLKTLFDWPTFPQLYVHGELIGGLDILNEMAEGGSSLTKELGVASKGSGDASASASSQLSIPSSLSLDERLTALINSNPIMLFMKGEPDQPRCGFSRSVVEILRSEDIPFGYFDILEDDDVRQGLKKFSDWPTYPQIYQKGELVGGLDILQEMRESGPLKEQLLG